MKYTKWFILIIAIQKIVGLSAQQDYYVTLLCVFRITNISNVVQTNFNVFLTNPEKLYG